MIMDTKQIKNVIDITSKYLNMASTDIFQENEFVYISDRNIPARFVYKIMTKSEKLELDKLGWYICDDHNAFCNKA